MTKVDEYCTRFADALLCGFNPMQRYADMRVGRDEYVVSAGVFILHSYSEVVQMTTTSTLYVGVVGAEFLRQVYRHRVPAFTGCEFYLRLDNLPEWPEIKQRLGIQL